MAILSCHVSIKLPPKISDGQEKAYEIYRKLAANYKGYDLDFVPDKKNHDYPIGWILRARSGTPRAEVRARVKDGDSYLWMRNEKSSFSFIRLVTLSEDPKQFLLRWKWKLDVSPLGDSKTGFATVDDLHPAKVSYIHPLNVIIVFPRGEKDAVALHYVWDPLEPKDKRYFDPAVDTILLPVMPPKKVNLVYPHIVVSSAADPLQEWIEVPPRDIAADFHFFYPDENLPKMFLVVVQTHCETDPVDKDQNQVAEGAIADLKFVEKSGKK